MIIFNSQEKYLDKYMRTCFSKIHRYKYKDSTTFENKGRLMWYAFLNWKIDNFSHLNLTGVVNSVEYIFPHKYFEFEHKHLYFRFLPLFEVTYNNIQTPEYYTMDNMLGKNPNNYRVLFHKYPNLHVRNLEPKETENIIKFMKKRLEEGKDWKKINQGGYDNDNKQRNSKRSYRKSK